MVCPSKCLGCKVLKSAHTFRHPGKNCAGPALVEHDEGTTSFVEVMDPLASDENVSTSAVSNMSLLHSLVDSVQCLSKEVQTIRQETLAQVSTA